MQVKLIAPVALDKSVAPVPVRVVRARKPRTGGILLAEFSNLDGRGVARATDYVSRRRHDIV